MAAPQTQAQPEGQAQAQGQAQAVKIALQIKSNLEQAGFKNIKLVPSAFIVRAEDKDNNPVVMVVNPGAIMSVSTKGASVEGNTQGTVTQGTVGQGAAASPDGSSSNDMNNSNGSTNPDH
jgi:hypothetical protein